MCLNWECAGGVQQAQEAASDLKHTLSDLNGDPRKPTSHRAPSCTTPFEMGKLLLGFLPLWPSFLSHRFVSAPSRALVGSHVSVSFCQLS